MRQLLQNLGNGQTTVVDVPAPGPRAGALLIGTTRSLISAGTERMLVDFGRAGWIGKARQQPEKVRAVINKIRANGLIDTVQAIRSKLAQPIALGYCQVGRVADAGGAEWVSPGDRVISNGPHAEVVSVAHDLCAKIPEPVSDDAATFTPLAAIALQGINLLNPGPGEKVVVTGLGLIGQLAVRILKAKGCDVLGLDPAAERRALAEQFGARTVSGDPVAAALSWTHGQGAAGVIITASTSSNEVVNQAARSCRHRGKVVLIGVVGLQLNRADFYRHEVSFQVSCSYGARQASAPNSARGNFDQVLAWMAAGRLAVEDLISHRFPFEAAASAYAMLADRNALGVMMTYDAPPALGRTVPLATARPHPEAGMAFIGAGNFASRSLLPAMNGVASVPAIRAVASNQGASAVLMGRTCGARYATTDTAAILADQAVNAVFITTRHNLHARQTIDALRAGKHVWVEKPLALTAAEVEAVATAAQAANRVLMVGFNRRFAPMAVALRQALAARSEPRRFVMTVNAGRLDPDHWTLDPLVGGGRIVGEACHFVDLMRYLSGQPIQSVRCVRRDTDGQDGGAFELRFPDGSTGLIDYRTDLPAHLPKEVIEVRGDGFEAVIENWVRLRARGLPGAARGGFWSRRIRKGQPEALGAFFAALQGGPAPIPLAEVLEVSRWSIALQAMTAASGEVCRPV